MIYWLDCDMHGTRSVSDVLESKRALHIPIPSYPAFQEATHKLVTKVKVGDLVVVDTLTQLLDTTRNDASLGTGDEVGLWEKRGKWLDGDKNYLTVYNMAQTIVMRPLRNIYARGARIICVCHEDDTIDTTTNTRRRVPKVNPALIDILIGQSSDVWRLIALPEDVRNAKGEVAHKADTRVLYLRRGEEYIAKYNVERNRSKDVPRFIVDTENAPLTLDRVYTILGGTFEWLTLYGPPGAGKTTLALSEPSPAASTNTATQRKGS